MWLYVVIYVNGCFYMILYVIMKEDKASTRRHQVAGAQQFEQGSQELHWHVGVAIGVVFGQ